MIRSLIRFGATVTIAVCQAVLESTTEGDRPAEFYGWDLPPVPDNGDIIPHTQPLKLVNP